MDIKSILLHVQWKAEGRKLERYECASLAEAYERIDALLKNESVYGFQFSVDCGDGSGKRPRDGAELRRALEMPAPCGVCGEVDELNNLYSCWDGLVRCARCFNSFMEDKE